MLFTLDDFMAGWLAGFAGTLVGHPFDTIKVRQQILNAHLLTTIKRTYKFEGIFGFYKGMLLPLLTNGPSNSVFFGIYGTCLRKADNDAKVRINFNDTNWMERVFLAGCVAGFVQVLIMCPVELVKTVLQSRTGTVGVWKKHYETPHKGMLHSLKDIYSSGGLRGLYRGFTPMLFRDGLTSGVYTLTYEAMVHLCSSFFTKNNEMFGHILAGGTAGITSWILIIPFDVVKSKIQADNPNKPLYKGMRDCIYKTYRSEGLRVFGKGFFIICCRAFPTNAAVFVGYEYSLKLLNYFHTHF